MRYEQNPSRVAADEQNERKQSRQSNAKRHKRRHKKNYILYYFILLFLVTVIGATLSLTVLFHVEKIKVTQNKQLDANQIIISSGVALDSNLLRLNSKEIERKVLKNNVALDAVKVIKRLPSTLEIQVQVGTTELAVHHNGQFYMISKAGRVIQISDKNHNQSICSIYGVSLAPQEALDNPKLGDTLDLKRDEFKICLSVIDAIKRNKLSKITKVDMTDLSTIKLYYENRIEIKIGNTTEIDYKLQMASEIIKTKISNLEKGILDVQINGKGYFKPETDLIIP